MTYVLIALVCLTYGALVKSSELLREGRRPAPALPALLIWTAALILFLLVLTLKGA